MAHLTLGSTEKARLAYAEAIEEFGTEEGARIGADDDLANLIQEGTRPAATARTVLERYWPNRQAIEELE